MLKSLVVVLAVSVVAATAALGSSLAIKHLKTDELLAKEARIVSFREPTYGGGGGFFMGNVQATFDRLNSEIAKMGIPGLTKGIYLWGGGGYGTVTPRLRIGGMGAGGSKKTGGTVSTAGGDTSYVRDFEVDFGYGGVILEYLVVATERVDVSLGALLGAGGVELQLTQRSGPDSWTEVWKNYQSFQGTNDHITSTLSAEFFAWNPYVTAKIWLTDWLAIKASGGYLGAKVSPGNWKESCKWTLSDSPEVDFSGFNVRVGFHFGYEGAL